MAPKGKEGEGGLALVESVSHMQEEEERLFAVGRAIAEEKGGERAGQTFVPGGGGGGAGAVNRRTGGGRAKRRVSFLSPT